MPSSFALGDHFESFIRTMVASGRYNNASEVVRDGLRALEDREERRIRRQSDLDLVLSKSFEDFEHGRFSPLEEVRSRVLGQIERDGLTDLGSK